METRFTLDPKQKTIMVLASHLGALAKLGKPRFGVSKCGAARPPGLAPYIRRRTSATTNFDDFSLCNSTPNFSDCFPKPVNHWTSKHRVISLAQAASSLCQ